MSHYEVRFAQSTASQEVILAHLTVCNDSHDPPLDHRVSLADYAAKLFANAVTFEAWYGGRLAGLVAAYLNDDTRQTGYITNVSVAPELKGKGLAKAMMQHCIAEARTRGFESMALEVRTNNAAAIALYRGLGFVESEAKPDSACMRISLVSDVIRSSRMRDLNKEYLDAKDRRYAYDFDWVVRKYLLRAISPYFKPGGRAIELGCYKGDMTEQILGYVDQLTVLEGSSELCDVVSKRFPGRLAVINSTFETALIERAFDMAFLVHTLEHLDDPVALLSRMRNWITHDGRLFVAVPNANALSRQIAVRMGLVNYNSAVTPAEREHGHRITYTMDTFLHHLRAAGFRIAQEGGILVKPLANFQFDQALKAGIITEEYLEGCYELGKLHPDICASLYAICELP